ncbi:PRC-barrel domain-containing protein [Streptomyces sp. M19]
MITQDQISTVLDHPVYDSEGAKIGEAKHVFVDDVTGEPDWVSVRTGLFGMNESFVPTRDARLVTDHLEVAYPKSKVKDAPHADIDGGDTCRPRRSASSTGTTGWTTARRSRAAWRRPARARPRRTRGHRRHHHRDRHRGLDRHGGRCGGRGDGHGRRGHGRRCPGTAEGSAPTPTRP